MSFVKYEPYKEPHRCKDPEHNPPGHIVLEPGVHVWKCPSCGQEQRVVVRPRPTC